ncbi:MAG: flagellar biosynthesis protein FlhF [Gammaproteobacteria bacterium]|nr:flagellar biosynthesis protein FlhF [Gammaproteobacteria bacterium]
MRIKRYFASTIREAIQKVRADQGPDAVILSNRNVKGGVEIVAAIDFDEVLLADPAMTAGSNRQEPGRQPVKQVPAAVAAPARPVSQQESASPYRRPRISQPETAPASPASGKSKTQKREHSLPALESMQEEIRSLRGTLESQMTSLIWKDQARRNPGQSELLSRLLKLELSPRLCRKVIDILLERSGMEMTWQNALAVLAHLVRVTDDDILTQGGVVALVGPTGVGKTTTIAKLAARFSVRHGSSQVALVTMDNYRIGAQEQLRSYARMMDIPFYVATSAHELQQVLRELSRKKLVLIDTAGMSQRDVRLGKQLSIISEGAARVKTYLVLSAATRKRSMIESIKAFGKTRLTGAILTKIDEVDRLGISLSVLIDQVLPLAYVSDGQRVPEDLASAKAHMVISRAVTLANQSDSQQSGMAVA